MFKLSVEKWRTLVAANAQGLPLEFLLAWMQYESGGNPAALGAITEVGLFQIDMQDGPRFGGDLDTLHRNFAPAASQTATRPLTDAEKRLQVTTGVAMVKAYRDASRTKLAAVGASWTEGSSDFWNLVKLHHGLPAIPRDFLPAFKRAKGSAPGSWSEWWAWIDSLSFAEVSNISHICAPYYFPDGRKGVGPRRGFGRFRHNAEESGKYGGVELVGGLSSLVVLTMIAVVMFFATR
jgi:hypothetical protein